MIGDPQPTGDKCDFRDTSTSVDPNNHNVGDALNAKQVTWGWFQGGFADCSATHTNVGGVTSKDYIPHHEPFQYFPSTANLAHSRPSSPDMIGRTDQANHQYDLTDFWTAVDHRNMPAVSFLKAPAYQDGHAGYSSPLDEQKFLISTINRLQKGRDWNSTAVVIAYDDSDGWYDHQMGPIVNQSQDPVNDALRQTPQGADCGSRADPQHTLGGYQDRCGYGPRLPLLVISRYARPNYVDHTTTDQTSILKFIEDKWSTDAMGNSSLDTKAGSLNSMFSFDRHHGQNAGTLQLDPGTGQPPTTTDSHRSAARDPVGPETSGGIWAGMRRTPDVVTPCSAGCSLRAPPGGHRMALVTRGHPVFCWSSGPRFGRPSTKEL